MNKIDFSDDFLIYYLSINHLLRYMNWMSSGENRKKMKKDCASIIPHIQGALSLNQVTHCLRSPFPVSGSDTAKIVK